MRPRRAWLLIAFAAAIFAAPATDRASAAAPPIITDLSVAGGEENWRPVNDFQLSWQHPPGQPPVSAVHHRVRDSSGRIVIPATQSPDEFGVIRRIQVPSAPDLYRAEVWLEGRDGDMGPIATAELRFDDLVPGPASPLTPGGWVSGLSPVVIRIAHPSEPLPVSGIRGYAVSVDRGTERPPCASTTRCTPAETDLSRGIHDDAISLGLLPEGLSFVRALAVSGSGLRSATVGSSSLRVDSTYPELELRGVPEDWSPHPVRLTATAWDALSGVSAAGRGGPYTAIAVDSQAPATAPGGTVSTTVRGEGVHRIAVYARDAAGNVADGEAGAPAPATAVVRVDETPPRVTFSPAERPSEPERIEATVSDALSGPDPDRGTISVRPAGSGQRFTPLPTAVSAGRLIAHWSSDDFPHGRYEFRATGLDAAGNAAVGDHRLGGARMVLSNPVKGSTELVSGFGGRRLVSRTAPYGRGTGFSGRLALRSGPPLGGLPVLVTETFAAGADPVRRETVARTRRDGTFLVRLAPGPSRRVQASFAGNPLLSRSANAPVRLGVRSSVRLRASAATARVGGVPVAFTGQVHGLGAPLPRGGLAVELQFRLRGSAWREFRTVQTDAAGRFRYSYAFADDDSRGVRFQFRAHLPDHPDWPYEPAASSPVLVTGR